MASVVKQYHLCNEDGFRIGKVEDHHDYVGLMLENKEIAFVIAVEVVKLESGHIHPEEKISHFYTRENLECDLKTGRIKLQ